MQQTDSFDGKIIRLSVDMQLQKTEGPVKIDDARGLLCDIIQTGSINGDHQYFNQNPIKKCGFNIRSGEFVDEDLVATEDKNAYNRFIAAALSGLCASYQGETLSDHFVSEVANKSVMIANAVLKAIKENG